MSTIIKALGFVSIFSFIIACSGQAADGTNATFLVELLIAASDSSYKVRAVKRVNVPLNRDGETKHFC